MTVSMHEFKVDYEHLRCSDCGGVIGIYDRENVTCEQCGKRFTLYRLKYDELKVNTKTGWMFPVKWKGLVVT